MEICIRMVMHTCSQLDNINGRKQIFHFHLSPNAFENIYHKTACVYTPITYIGLSGYVWETIQNLFMRNMLQNITKCSTGKPRTQWMQLTSSRNRTTTHKIKNLKPKWVCVCCCVGGFVHFSRAPFVSSTLCLSHSKSILTWFFLFFPSFSLRLMYINNTRQITREAERT